MTAKSRCTSAAAIALLLTFVSAVSAQETHSHRPGQQLGEVSFANSGARAAQEPFQRGLALLHSFEYEEAGEAFRAAQKADPDFAMAYWAEAFTYTHPLWGQDDAEAARAVLQRLGTTRGARLQKAGTDRERAYGAAIESFYANADLPIRVQAFAAGMRTVLQQYPDDIDAIAFTSLASMLVDYLGGGPPAERRAARDQAITLAERVFQKNPQHPGGTHYLIHATDDPEFAARGLDAARTYARIASDAEHALHMPSHIFLQLGLWNDVVASNERAWAASRAEVIERKLSNADLSFHALQWLQYGYLQQGRYNAAAALIDTARTVLTGVNLDSLPYPDARHVIAQLEFMQWSHTGRWRLRTCAGEPSKARPATSDRERGQQTLEFQNRAIASAYCGNPDAPNLVALRQRLEGLAESDPMRRSLANTLVHVNAVLAQTAGDYARVIELLTPVITAPPRPPVGPPGLPRTFELFGEALLKSGRAGEAVTAYERALQLTPKRSEALLGLARARAAAGDAAGATATYRQLVVNWERADRGVAAVAEARKGSQE
ncbi:MAG: tetratricopeptide repeat protein [Gemmatimonadota bacterium]